MDESGTDRAECSRNVASGRRAAGIIWSLVNDRDLQIEWAEVLHGTLLVPVLMYGSETILWKEKEKSRIMAVQMDNLTRLLGIRRMDWVPNVQIRELCRVKKGLDERIDEGVLQWFSHVERMEMDWIAKRVYIGKCASSHSVGRLWKRWFDTTKECLKKRGLDVRQTRKMVQDRSERWVFVRRNAWGIVWGMNPRP